MAVRALYRTLGLGRLTPSAMPEPKLGQGQLCPLPEPCNMVTGHGSPGNAGVICGSDIVDECPDRRPQAARGREDEVDRHVV